MGNLLIKAEELSEEEVEKFDSFLQSCWKYRECGIGSDARGLSHSGIKIRKVTMFHNPITLEKYKEKKKTSDSEVTWTIVNSSSCSQ